MQGNLGNLRVTHVLQSCPKAYTLPFAWIIILHPSIYLGWERPTANTYFLWLRKARQLASLEANKLKGSWSNSLGRGG